MLERKWMKREGSNRPYIQEIVKGIIQTVCWCPYSVLVFIIGTEVYLKYIKLDLQMVMTLRGQQIIMNTVSRFNAGRGRRWGKTV